MLVSNHRDLATTRRVFTHVLSAAPPPVNVITDQTPVYPRVLDELVLTGRHVVERHAHNPIETDHGRQTACIRPMRRLQRDRSARVVAAGHASVQNLRCGHYELAIEAMARGGVTVAFTELVDAV